MVLEFMFKKSTCQPSCKRRRRYQIQYKHESLSWGERETSQIQIQKSKKTRLISQSKTFKSSWEFCRYSNSLLLPSSRISLNNTLPFPLHSYHVFSFLGFFYIFYFYFTKITNRPFVLIHFCVNKTQQARFLNVCEKFQTFYVVRCYLQVASFLFYVAHWCIPKHRYS